MVSCEFVGRSDLFQSILTHFEGSYRDGVQTVSAGYKGNAVQDCHGLLSPVL